MSEVNSTENQGRCEVCGGTPPPGHRFCDNCWPDAAVAAGKADYCEVCGQPKVIEKLSANNFGQLVCANCAAQYQNLMPEFVIKELLIKHHLTIATAESCTGGLVGNRITDVTGSSAYFYGGILSYDNGVKQGVLGVPAEVLNTVGAVSKECALAMADGARRVVGTQIGVSTTGIAGPTGATQGKPVGTVYIALTAADGFRRCERYVWNADRIGNKQQSAEAALRMLVEYLQQL